MTESNAPRLSELRCAVERQLGDLRSALPHVDPSEVIRFADDLPEHLEPTRRQELQAAAERLQPWLQGPFHLGGDLVIGGVWRNDLRWEGLGEHVPRDLGGARVLDVGSNAGYDPFMWHRRGAEYVLACEPFEFHEQARFLESIYRTGIDFRQIGWQDLSPKTHGQFDLVHCHGVLYHEPHPLALLQRLRAMLSADGELVLGSMMLAGPERPEFVRFVPNTFYGDPTWWWVPGRLALRWMLESIGIAVLEEFGESPGPPGGFPVVNGYFRGRAAPPVIPPPPDFAPAAGAQRSLP